MLFRSHAGSFIAVHGLFSSCGVWALEHAGSVVAVCGLSSCGAWAPEHMGSVVVAHKLSSCGAWAIEHTGLVAPWHVGSYFRNQGSNSCPLHWKMNS